MNQQEIIGNAVKFQNLEIAENDFPNQMDWPSAINVCTQLGEGWRLPTKKELQQMFKNQEKIGGFTRLDYWSSTEGVNTELAWFKNFFKGENATFKRFSCRVRAVRDIV